MARNEVYEIAERKIEEAVRKGSIQLDLSVPYASRSIDRLKELPESLGRLTELEFLDLGYNALTRLPAFFSDFKRLRSLSLRGNPLEELPAWLLSGPTSLIDLSIRITGLRKIHRPRNLPGLANLRHLNLSASLGTLPEWIRGLKQLERLFLTGCELHEIPEWLGELTQLKELDLSYNEIIEVPATLARLPRLRDINLGVNPLNPELAAAEKQGFKTVLAYLRAKDAAQTTLHEAKLILVGEGEVGKSCLLGALRDDPWEEKASTHGIEIKSLSLPYPEEEEDQRGISMTLNGWDFGGQDVYKPTHQLFFSAPAVYLVAWKPREGVKQGQVKEWIKLIKLREPDARVLVVATHGGPANRQPDIDRQELWDLFGKESVIDFFHVDSKPRTPDGKAADPQIARLREVIARTAAALPEMGRSFPAHWQEVRVKLKASGQAYLSLQEVMGICRDHEITTEDAAQLIRICHRIGDLIHYEHDPLLKDIVVIRPDWLAVAISFVLDDKQTRESSHGLVDMARLATLWNDPTRPEEHRYAPALHDVFLRLMERYDLSYRVSEPHRHAAGSPSLIAQLVPDTRPEQRLTEVWPPVPCDEGDSQQTQICRIVETANNQSAPAEGLFYQLIVRLHKYSLGRADFCHSVHWQRGLVIEDDTGARALLEHAGNDVRITVRSPYPPRFLAALTYEVEWLVGDFWNGLRCDVTVPCLAESGGQRCKGLIEVKKLLENKARGRHEQPCPTCNEWQDVGHLLANSAAAVSSPFHELQTNGAAVLKQLEGIRQQMSAGFRGVHAGMGGLFAEIDASGRRTVAQVEASYTALMTTLLDEAKDGPRLFSFEIVDPDFWGKLGWEGTKVRISLWCEYCRVPLCHVPGSRSMGVYELDIPRDWVIRAAPFLKMLASTLGLLLPVAGAAAKVIIEEASYKLIENQLELAKEAAEAVLTAGGNFAGSLTDWDGLQVTSPGVLRARGAQLRDLHRWLKEKDPGFGGLVRVQNKRHEFEWVHPKFAGEY